MHPTIPDKLYFKIGEVGKLAQVPTHVLRYWETEFKAIKPKRASSQQRLYRRQDVELIIQIKSLLHEQGYTIAGAKKLIERGHAASPITPSTAAAPGGGTGKKSRLALDALGQIKRELQRLQQVIEKK